VPASVANRLAAKTQGKILPRGYKKKNLPEKLPTGHDLQKPSIQQTATSAQCRSTKGILHRALPFLIAGAVLCAPIASPVLATNGAQADDIGPSAVDGVTCEQYAFRQEGVDWQIWIQLGEFPLPRKLVIRTLTDDAKPQHSEILTWNLAPSFSENAFTFDSPADARRITIAQVNAAAAGKNK
jgi:Predicted periplasmic protein (DUF2092)